MKVLRDFLCPTCNEMFESFVDNTVRLTTCPDCGNQSKVVYHTMNFKLDGLDPGFPGAYDKWARNHEKASKVKE